MKSKSRILTFLLFLYGLTIFILILSIGEFGLITLILTISSIVGFTILGSNQKLGSTIMLIVSTTWLLRYFEHASYLVLYEPNNWRFWIMTSIPIIIGFPLFIITLKEKLNESNLKWKNLHWGFFLVLFFSIGLLSFIYKPHTDEFNCWYYFNDNEDSFKVEFAVAPGYVFETISNSNELRQIIKTDGMTFEGRKGFYSPETKVRVITRFKKVIGLKILGFRNTEVNKLVRFKNPIKMDTDKITGNTSILQPEFSLGD